MRIAIGADHGGVDLKDEIAAHLRGAGHDVVDAGTHGSASVDYPDFARAVTAAIASAEVERGVLICGTGQGMAMTANKVPGIRAGAVGDVFSARMIREHNDAQVICLGARVTGPSLALEIVDAFVAADFEGGRHARRVTRIEQA
jgi:ribose 5-phosphate isomerase B